MCAPQALDGIGVVDALLERQVHRNGRQATVRAEQANDAAIL